MKWIIGIDGGGTKTIACAADMEGNILVRVEKGSTNYHVVGLEQFQAVVGGLIDEICVEGHLHLKELMVISLGLAGVDRKGDRELILAALARLNLDCVFVVNNDASIALTAGLGKSEGIVLIAGTGSIAYGINGRGEVIRAGGWGHIISDEGSGYDIGRQALIRVVKSTEGRERNSQLLDMIKEELAIANIDGLIQFIYGSATSKAAIAALAKIVIKAAEAGDAVASEILLQAADSLAGLVESVINRGFPDGQTVEVCTYGGVIQHSSMIRLRLTAKLAGKVNVIACGQEPVMGALQLGYNYLKDKSAGK